MQVAHHSLLSEFPEYRDTIQRLAAEDARFAHDYEKYEALTQQIETIERENLRIDDEALEQLKLERVHLKDVLYAQLRARHSMSERIAAHRVSSSV